ncbi:MAG: hypothetical protein H0T46_27455 [Deltaproteobacteria bacterium]|nr:hypothetical protein [Deltaproteobacteria bacterium]
MTTPLGLFARLFQRPVHVSATNIFTRMISSGVQALAYSMNLDTREPVAMVLPLPVAPGSGEHAVTFVDLSAEPKLFEDLAKLFEIQQPLARKGGLQFPSRSAPTLVVHKVGSFVASYVPTRADFARLDPRFRLPEVLFDAVPHYTDYGFAVFQLEPGKVTVHPMALTFPTRESGKLFFPTVHVHDGTFHERAKFDHALYFQTPRCTELPKTAPYGGFEGDAIGWIEPSKDYAGLIVPKQAMLRRTLHGKRANEDTWITA